MANYSDNFQQLLSNRILVIAEKPSVERAICEAMQSFGVGKTMRQDGYSIVGQYVVTHCLGHLLQLLPPDRYHQRYKKWTVEDLPIFPHQFLQEVAPADHVKKQFQVLKQLILAANKIINAGDPDREGQLLVDELFDYLNLPAGKKAQIQRVMISDLSAEGVAKAFRNLKSNQEYFPLYSSALARQQADWLLGMNMSRAATVYAQKQQFSGAISIGRVLTPLLALVVKRDQEIANFVPHDYYHLFAKVFSFSNPSYQVLQDGVEIKDRNFILKLDLLRSFEVQRNLSKAKLEDLVNDEEFSQYVDEAGRLVNADFVKSLLEQKFGFGNITKFNKRNTEENSPLGFSLSDLQQAMFNIFGVEVSETLKIAQQLYEKGVITYPRTDCGYLNDEDFADRVQIINHLAQQSKVIPGLSRINGTNFSRDRRSRIWNSSKVENHSAIVPTKKAVDFNSLAPAEKQVYQLIAQRYLQQFMSPATYSEVVVEAEFILADKVWIFAAKSKAIIEHGWKILTLSEKNYQALRTGQNAEDLMAGEGYQQEASQDTSSKSGVANANNRISNLLSKQVIQGLMVGDSLEQTGIAVETSKTSPPAHFNEATLLSAMTHIARYVDNPELKKILNETDGLGTEATRATIIDKLFTYKYCQKVKKEIHATAIGIGLIQALPVALTEPGVTAVWENYLNQIAKKQLNKEQFISGIQQEINAMLLQLQQQNGVSFQTLAGLSSKPNSNSRYSNSRGSSYRSGAVSKNSYSRSSKSGSSAKRSYSKKPAFEAPF